MTQNNSRRDFIKASTILAIGFSFSSLGKAENIHKIDTTTAALGIELDPYILINDDGKIILFNARPDMGQGTYQSLPLLIAEELEVTLDQVEIRNTDGQGKYGAQLSGGSSSVRTRWLPMRKAGAAVKEMLITAASKKWQVPTSECYAQTGKVFHKPSGKSYTYGELVEEASKLEVPKNPKLKHSKDFRLLGKSVPRPEIPSKVNGTAVFGIDSDIPGMLFASIERSPTIHGKVVNFDSSAAMKVKGVKHVLKSERKMPHKAVETVAVVADTYWGALKGRRALKITWDAQGSDKISTDAYFENLRTLAKTEGQEYKKEKVGDFNKGFEGANKKIEAQYETPFLAHAPLEPENATVWVQGDKVEVWAPIQGPDGLITQLAQYLNIKPENVKVNVPFMGGAFGRKAYFDYVMEAANLSKQIKAPVKVIWTREDDTTQGPFRPGMLSAMQGGLDAKGNVVALNHKIVGSSIQHQVFGNPLKNAPDDWAIETANTEDSPYDFTNRKASFHLAETDIPILWWRSVYSSTTAFGQESFIDELAHAANIDPLAFRLDMLADASRFTRVLQTLAKKADYHQKLPENQAIGIAIARSFGTIVAHAVTVSKNGKGVKIDKVVSVIDCGMTVNPDNIKAQTDGNIVMGLTAAIKNGITFKDGMAEQSNFHQYNVLRFSEMPKTEVHIINNEEAPGGVGEPGLPPFAPALCNAIYNLTGKRIRTLPFDIDNIG
ncbi:MULTISPECIES: molybdopterin cofactor-binding domain-containing protein [unclassified Arcicella]|uniref:xanthine dehydrogenase family protein molybdopterin-binding subunit n=1 Tax=unclassified Arcicella TaxID=2644986 RepID=UPI00285EF4A7|nr:MULTISPECIES: molybdopterin cofactor-binding domain-containing protein [unclassified Arcicella]MDR6562753.1 isoquinoline 1-oxidoreductase beta subunit [Arcicella sp. BE51]MDR6812902.1 isoquinoline 1-oxidoreductase beta subunit [Arcicella sp. BE140]MDR6824216.1 isoquinoline 1-oxidoreductase beta subunit [Arcicella sp. BE139]